jgi:hypothetical protein
MSSPIDPLPSSSGDDQELEREVVVEEKPETIPFVIVSEVVIEKEAPAANLVEEERPVSAPEVVIEHPMPEVVIENPMPEVVIENPMPAVVVIQEEQPQPWFGGMSQAQVYIEQPKRRGQLTLPMFYNRIPTLSEEIFPEGWDDQDWPYDDDAGYDGY